MNELWTIIGSVGLSSIAAIGLIKFLSKKFIEQQLQKDIIKFKNELNERTEVLKTTLSIHANEQNIILSRVDAQKAEAVRKVHSALCKWVNSASMMTTSSLDTNVRPKKIIAHYKKKGNEALLGLKRLFEVISDNSIYFTEDSYNRLLVTFRVCFKAIEDFAALFVKYGEYSDENEHIIKEIEDAIIEVDNLFANEVNPLLDDLSDDFRKILGVKGKD